jgi:hypothetical protein
LLFTRLLAVGRFAELVKRHVNIHAGQALEPDVDAAFDPHALRMATLVDSNGKRCPDSEQNCRPSHRVHHPVFQGNAQPCLRGGRLGPS